MTGRRASLLAALLAASGPSCTCGAAGDGSCRTEADCPPGQSCVDGRCTTRDAIGDEAEAAPEADDGLAEETAGDAPCPPARRCGASCCAETERCDLGRCRPDCGALAVCGDPPACCTADQACLGTACVPLGAACGRCTGCAAGEFCDPTLGRCLPAGAADESCVFRPPPGGFDPVLLWTWTGEGSAEPARHHVIMMPVVGPLDDDDGDGAITGCDFPEVAFIAYTPGAENDAWLRVLDGRTGTLDAEANDLEGRLANQTQIAAGDVDGDGRVEIVAGLAGTSSFCGRWGWHADLIPAAFRVEGSALREVWRATERTATGGGGPAIADLEGDGSPEVLVGDLVLRGADGTLRWRAANGPGINPDCGPSNVASLPIAVDLDDDGDLEVLIGRTAYEPDGTVMWSRVDLPEGVAAVADVDADALPEIAYVAAGTLAVLERDGSTVCGPVSPAEASIGVGGAPTIADFDGAPDGRPEIGVAGRSRYSVFRPDCTLLATADNNDNSAVTSSTVFDLEGDGTAEIVYADEANMYVYRYDGTARLAVVLSVPNSSATGLEGPVVADVNADGRAEFVVVSNGATGGVRAYRDALDRWASTRPIWNQHAYHVTNVGDDGSIPAGEPPHWTAEGGNSFRRNRLLGNEQWVPDLVPDGIDADGSRCPERLVLLGRVRNAGALTAPPGVPVTFYRGDPGGAREAVGTVRTAGPIAPGGSEAIRLEWAVPPEDRDATLEFFYVVDDDGTGAGERSECREDNNVSPALEVSCLLG
jgi:hypothetical protein